MKRKATVQAGRVDAKGKRSEEVLLESTELYLSLLETSPDAIVLTDLDNNITMVNLQAVVLLGFTEEELLEKSFLDITAPEDRPHVSKNLEKTLGSGGVKNVEYTLLKKNGEKFPGELSASLILDQEWKPKAVIRIVRDITDRKQAEEELLHAKEFIETVFDSINDAISIIDVENFKIIDVNRVFLDQLDLRKEDVIGNTCYEITHHRSEPCTPPDDMCPLKDTLLTGKYASYEHIHYRSDDKKEYVEVSAHPMTDISGKVTHVVHVARNISERKEAEEVLKNYVGQLEEANRLKDLFGDIVRHDLMNPLQAIMMFMDVIGQEPDLPENLKDPLDTAIECSNHAIDLVTSATLFSKLDTVDDIVLNRLDLSSVLEDSVSLVKGEFGEKANDVVLKFKDEISFNGNELISQVFINLISNAVKYTPEGTKIEVDVQDDGDQWTVSVKDWGEGIPDEYKEQLFTRFKRIEKKGVKGTGLGLAIAKRIVDLHKGQISVEDNPEGGSIFFVRLPKGL